MFKTSLSPNVNSRPAWGNVMRTRFKNRVQGRQVLEPRGTAFVLPTPHKGLGISAMGVIIKAN